MIPQPRRSREDVLGEIEDASAHRQHANETDDFDSYQHLCEQIDDLRIELYRLSSRRQQPMS